MADNNIRSGQLLSPFGIGQIVNFPKEVSMMICGLDLWDEKLTLRRVSGGMIDESTLKIIEPRLQKLLGVDFFKKPYPYTTSSLKNSFLTIPAVRFPKWHHCTNPTCSRMREVELTFSDEKVECPVCNSKMIPVRFVAACEHGHIQDVPFKEWSHDGPVPRDNNEHNLTYISGSGSGDLGSIYIKCSCGKGKSLAGIMNVSRNGHIIFNSALASIGLNREESDISATNPNQSNPTGQYCKGERPWLGLEGINDSAGCGAHLQVLIRGGSNIHYSNIMSALFLPESDELSNPAVENVIQRLGKTLLRSFMDQDSSGIVLSSVLRSQQEVINKTISLEELEDSIREILKTREESEIKSEFDLRYEEFKYIIKGRVAENADFKAIRKTFELYDQKELLSQFFDFVVLIEKLKEVRVFTGFSRITPESSPVSRTAKMRELSKDPIKWLPGNEVFGEGIFLKFNEEHIQKWEASHRKHFEPLIQRYNAAMGARRRDYKPRDINSAFLMIHTFAHLLIKRLCFDCGYGSSSLRERIYFSTAPEKKMSGVLIYTSSGDSEGSLGGLVRQGREKFLGKLIKDSIEDARWCSADPVCSDIGHSSGQGPDNVNGSACHNCCIVPETSCEEFNMILDRSAVIGTVENPSLGYFS